MKTNKIIFILSLVLVFISTTGESQSQNVYHGKASWYGKKFHGRTTASGEIYNMYHMTAAHKTLDFGTYVKVTNVENKRSVIVKINDRGPFIKNRIIDLSKVAAVKLDFIEKGTVSVKVEILGKEKPKITYDESNTLYRPSTNKKAQKEKLTISAQDYRKSVSFYKKADNDRINIKSIDIKNFSFLKEDDIKNEGSIKNISENELKYSAQENVEYKNKENKKKTKIILIEVKEKVKKTDIPIFKLQLGAYKDIKSANDAQKQMLNKGIETTIVLLEKDKTIFRLLTKKTFSDYQSAKEIQEILESNNIRSLLIPL